MVSHGGRASTKADRNRDVESFCAAFEDLKLAMQDVKGDRLRLVVSALGEDQILRLASSLKSAVDDYGTPAPARH
jgi:hypothetical protein